MSTTELKAVVDRASPEERLFLEHYLAQLRRSEDPEYAAELDHRMADMDAGMNSVSWKEAVQLLDKLERPK